MTATGPAVIAFAALCVALPCSSPAAAQRKPATPAAPLDERQTKVTEQHDAEAPDRDTEGRPRTGLRGWIRKRLQAPAKPSLETGGGFSPAAGTVVSGSGLAGGASYRWMNVLPRGVDAQLGGMVSLRGYQEYAGVIGWLGRDRSTVAFDTADTAVASLFNAATSKEPGRAVYLDVRHRLYPRHRYFGTGIDSRADDESDYTLSGTSVDGVVQRQFTPEFGVSIRGGWMHLRTGAGRDDAFVDVQDRFAATGLPGLTQQSAFATLGAGAAWDARDNPQAPEEGWFVGASLRQFAAMSDAGESFARATVDWRGYRPVPGGVIALRGLTSADLGGTTPFYLQPALGGAITLRGFHNYRFMDRTVAHASVEYRWRVHRYIEVAPFLDAGTASTSWGRLALGRVEATPGIGLRGRTDRRVLGRMDWSYSREGHRIILGVGPAF
jgi:outer membrane protein assembly factor BamA